MARRKQQAVIWGFISAPSIKEWSLKHLALIVALRDQANLAVQNFQNAHTPVIGAVDRCRNRSPMASQERIGGYGWT